MVRENCAVSFLPDDLLPAAALQLIAVTRQTGQTLRRILPRFILVPVSFSSRTRVQGGKESLDEFYTDSMDISAIIGLDLKFQFFFPFCIVFYSSQLEDVCTILSEEL